MSKSKCCLHIQIPTITSYRHSFKHPPSPLNLRILLLIGVHTCHLDIRAFRLDRLWPFVFIFRGILAGFLHLRILFLLIRIPTGRDQFGINRRQLALFEQRRPRGPLERVERSKLVAPGTWFFDGQAEGCVVVRCLLAYPPL